MRQARSGAVRLYSPLTAAHTIHSSNAEVDAAACTRTARRRGVSTAAVAPRARLAIRRTGRGCASPSHSDWFRGALHEKADGTNRRNCQDIVASNHVSRFRDVCCGTNSRDGGPERGRGLNAHGGGAVRVRHVARASGVRCFHYANVPAPPWDSKQRILGLWKQRSGAHRCLTAWPSRCHNSVTPAAATSRATARWCQRSLGLPRGATRMRAGKPNGERHAPATKPSRDIAA